MERKMSEHKWEEFEDKNDKPKVDKREDIAHDTGVLQRMIARNKYNDDVMKKAFGGK